MNEGHVFCSDAFGPWCHFHACTCASVLQTIALAQFKTQTLYNYMNIFLCECEKYWIILLLLYLNSEVQICKMPMFTLMKTEPKQLLFLINSMSYINDTFQSLSCFSFSGSGFYTNLSFFSLFFFWARCISMWHHCNVCLWLYFGICSLLVFIIVIWGEGRYLSEKH